MAAVLVGCFCFAGTVAQLPEAAKPKRILVDGNQLYVVEKSTIHIYSLKVFKHLKQFLKRGEGPGEAKSVISLKIGPDSLLVREPGKVMFFSKDGNFEKEIRINRNFTRISHLAKNFVGVFIQVDKETRGDFLSVNVFDKDFNIVKTVHKGAIHNAFKAGKKDMELITDFFDYAVYNDQIYVADTRNGFSIKVYDKHGDPLFAIDKEYEKIKVAESFKKNYLDRAKKSPYYERTSKIFNYVFREYRPAIYSFWVNNEKIYVLTHKTKGDEEKMERELVIMDLKGKILERTFVPAKTNVYIFNDIYYWLEENEKKEVWEIHTHQIK